MNIINIPEVWSTPTWWISSAFHNFFSTIKNWDFSILKIVLIIIWICLPFVIIYLFVRWRIAGYNINFWDWYGLKLITGTFWAWKTKFTFLKAFLWKKLHPEWILIANMPYDFVDIPFDSVKDFRFVLRDLCQYIRDTNSPEFLKTWFPPIKFITDEAHIYLFARDFKNFTKDSLILLTQCRKRELWVDFITQELWQIEVFIRRLCPYIQYYQEAFRLWKDTVFVKESILYSKDVEQTTITNENWFEEVDYSFLLPFNWTARLKKKLLTPYFDQKYLTYYVVWSTDVYSNDTDIEDDKVSHNYENFVKLMTEKRALYLQLKNIHEQSFIDKLSLSLYNFYLNTPFWKKQLQKKEIDNKLQLKRHEFLIKVMKDYLWEDKFNEILINKPELNKYNNWFSENDIIEDVLDTQADMIWYVLSTMTDEEVWEMQSLFRFKEHEAHMLKLEKEKNYYLHKLYNCWFKKTTQSHEDWETWEVFEFDCLVSPDWRYFRLYDYIDAYNYAVDNNLIKEEKIEND